MPDTHKTLQQHATSLGGIAVIVGALVGSGATLYKAVHWYDSIAYKDFVVDRLDRLERVGIQNQIAQWEGFLSYLKEKERAGKADQTDFVEMKRLEFLISDRETELTERE